MELDGLPPESIRENINSERYHDPSSHFEDLSQQAGFLARPKEGVVCWLRLEWRNGTQHLLAFSAGAKLYQVRTGIMKGFQ